MLRWSVEHVRFALSRNTVVAIRTSVFPLKRIIDKRILRQEEGQESRGWSWHLSVVRDILSDYGPVTRRRLSIVLSAQFVKYTVVPWGSGLFREADRTPLLRHMFVERYGNACAWEVEYDKCGGLKSRLACAVKPQLLSDIRTLGKEFSVNSLSIRPFLIEAFNSVRKSIETKDAWFILPDDGSVHVSRIHGRDWQNFHTCRANEESYEEFISIFERISLAISAGDTNQECVYIFRPHLECGVNASRCGDGRKYVVPDKTAGYGEDEWAAYVMAALG